MRQTRTLAEHRSSLEVRGNDSKTVTAEVKRRNFAKHREILERRQAARRAAQETTLDDALEDFAESDMEDVSLEQLKERSVEGSRRKKPRSRPSSLAELEGRQLDSDSGQSPPSGIDSNSGNEFSIASEGSGDEAGRVVVVTPPPPQRTTIAVIQPPPPPATTTPVRLVLPSPILQPPVAQQPDIVLLPGVVESTTTAETTSATSTSVAQAPPPPAATEQGTTSTLALTTSTPARATAIPQTSQAAGDAPPPALQTPAASDVFAGGGGDGNILPTLTGSGQVISPAVSNAPIASQAAEASSGGQSQATAIGIAGGILAGLGVMMYIVVYLLKKRNRKRKQGSIPIRYFSEGSSNESNLTSNFPADEKRETVFVAQSKNLGAWNDPAFTSFEESGLNEKQYQAYRRLHGQVSVRESLSRMYQNAKSHFSFGSTTRQSEATAPYTPGLAVPSTPVPPLPTQRTVQDAPDWPMQAHVKDSKPTYGRGRSIELVSEYGY